MTEIDRLDITKMHDGLYGLASHLGGILNNSKNYGPLPEHFGNQNDEGTRAWCEAVKKWTSTRKSLEEGQILLSERPTIESMQTLTLAIFDAHTAVMEGIDRRISGPELGEDREISFIQGI